MHRVNTPFIADLGDAAEDRTDASGKHVLGGRVRRFYRYDRREFAAAQEILKFISSKGPGQEIALIFGERHIFNRAKFSPTGLPDELLPRVISKTPKVNRPSNWRDMLEAEHGEERQMAIIAKADYIEPVRKDPVFEKLLSLR